MSDETERMSKEFLHLVHKLLVDGINFGSASECMNRADQIEDLCKGFCEAIKETK